ncbi:MAG: MFS transporter [Chloroflexi bacterium]|nr:MFS transporter [Chloroflexota bacterium]
MEVIEDASVTVRRSAPARPASTRAFSYRDYRIYWFGSYAAFLGQRLNVVALSILVFDMTGSTLKLGLVAAANAVPTIIFNLFGGVLADRMDTRRLLRYTALATTGMLTTLAVLIATGTVVLWHVFVLATLSGIVIGFDNPTRQAYFPRLVPPRATKSAVNLNGAMMASASVVMPTIGGLLIAGFGTATGFFVAAGGYAAMTASTWLLPARRPVLDQAHNVFADFRAGVSFIVRTRLFSVIIGLNFASMFFVFGYIQILPAFVKEFGGGDPQVGFLFSAAGIGALSGIVVAGRIRPGRWLGWTILGAALIFSSLVFVAAHAPDYRVVLPLVAIGHFGNGMFMITSMTALQLRVPDELRGRVMGIYAVNQSLAILGGLWAGTMGDLLTVRWGVALGPIVVVSLIVLVALTQRQVTGLRDDVEERTTGKRFVD